LQRSRLIVDEEDTMFKMQNTSLRGLFALCICFSIFISGTVWADEITDSIKEAVDYYKTGDLVEAANSLDYASQLIRQKRSGELKTLLPGPLAGWSAGDIKSNAAGAGYLGGMISARREYRKDKSFVSIEIITDSPALQSMAMLFSNPAYATADGGKLTKINRQKAIIKYKPSRKDGEINIVVGKQYLVNIKGRKIKEADLVDYASAIDYKKLEKF